MGKFDDEVAGGNAVNNTAVADSSGASQQTADSAGSSNDAYLAAMMVMPPVFTLLQLQRTVEALSGVRLHKQNFRRLVEQQGLVEETGGISATTGGRPARLVRFRREVLLERPAPGLRLRAGRRSMTSVAGT